MLIRTSLLCFGTLAVVAACANINAIARTTTLPGGYVEGGDGRPREQNGRLTALGAGTAIHLDIQQRLFVSNALGEHCAEPSPDALAAFVTALGIGGGAATQGAVSSAFGSGSNAASVGLRTQSITLMRDALFQMCLAYANGEIEGPQVMALLGRNQDLTAMVLATEQLTGAAVAQQAALTTSSQASATASMVSSLKALQEVNELVTRAEARVVTAETNLSRTEAALKEADDANRAFRTGQRDAAQVELKAAQDSLAAARETQAKVASAHEAVLTSAAASTDGDAEFTQSSGGGLADAADMAVAKSVEAMVTTVLGKSYIIDYCLSIITATGSAIPQDTRQKCLTLIEVAAEREQIFLQGRVDRYDPSSDCIRDWLRAEPTRPDQLADWFGQRKIDPIRIPDFLGNEAYETLRSSFIADKKLACSR